MTVKAKDSPVWLQALYLSIPAGLCLWLEKDFGAYSELLLEVGVAWIAFFVLCWVIRKVTHGRKAKNSNTTEQPTCPYCRMEISPDARLCRFCKSKLTGPSPLIAFAVAATFLIVTFKFFDLLDDIRAGIAEVAGDITSHP